MDLEPSFLYKNNSLNLFYNTTKPLLGKFFLKGGHYYEGGHYSAALSSSGDMSLWKLKLVSPHMAKKPEKRSAPSSDTIQQGWVLYYL